MSIYEDSLQDSKGVNAETDSDGIPEYEAGPLDPIWQVYDSCAEWCAKRGLTGKIGDPLPNLLDSRVAGLINADPEAFEERVRNTAYALAMEGKL